MLFAGHDKGVVHANSVAVIAQDWGRPNPSMGWGCSDALFLAEQLLATNGGWGGRVSFHQVRDPTRLLMLEQVVLRSCTFKQH